MINNYIRTKLDREREINNRYKHKTPDNTIMVYLKKKNKELIDENKKLKEENAKLIEKLNQYKIEEVK